MKTFTPEDIKKLRPCAKYTLDYIRDLWAGREAITADEIAQLPIHVTDVRWCILRLAADPTRRLARKMAADVLDKWNAPEIVREWIETGDESIRLKASAAAWAASAAACEASAAARAASAASCEAAAMAAAMAATSAAAAWKAAAELEESAWGKYTKWAIDEINSQS